MEKTNEEVLNSSELARALAELIVQRKGSEVHLLDMREITDIADWFVVASAQSRRHLRTLSADIEDELKSAGIGHFGIEGTGTDSWVIIDLFNVVVHIFIPERRAFFGLEDYWADAPVEIIEDIEPIDG